VEEINKAFRKRGLEGARYCVAWHEATTKVQKGKARWATPLSRAEGVALLTDAAREMLVCEEPRWREDLSE
jgi:hypothetical protein